MASTSPPGPITLTQNQLNTLLASLRQIIPNRNSNNDSSLDLLLKSLSVDKSADAKITGKQNEQQQERNNGLMNKTALLTQKSSHNTTVKSDSKNSTNTHVKQTSTSSNKQTLNNSNNRNRKQNVSKQLKHLHSDSNGLVYKTKNLQHTLRASGADNIINQALTDKQSAVVNDPKLDYDEDGSEPKNNNILGNVAIVMEPATHTSQAEKPPDTTSLSSPSNAVTSPLTTLPPVVRGHMTVAEKRRLKLQAEEHDPVVPYDPWGKPGCGAPMRPISDTQTVSSHEVINSVPQVNSVSPLKFDPIGQSSELPKVRRLEPVALRSSFVVGTGGLDLETNQSAKEAERKRWLLELDKQRAEQRTQKAKELDTAKSSEPETWADRHLPLSPAYNVSSVSVGNPLTSLDNKMENGVAEARVNSAPNTSASNHSSNGDRTYIRGQNVYIDPVTLREKMEKRQKQLEYQAAILAQVDERERSRRVNKEQDMREAMDEEMKHYSSSSTDTKMWRRPKDETLTQEVKEKNMDEMVMALEKARFEAQKAKHLKRIEHLRRGGHDTQKLEENLEDEPRMLAIPTPCPPTPYAAGITPRHHNSPPPNRHSPVSNEHTAGVNVISSVIIPNQSSPRECATQTDESSLIQVNSSRLINELSDAQIEYVPKKYTDPSERTAEKATQKPKLNFTKTKLSERPRWGYHNPKQTVALKQSDREVADDTKRQQKELRRMMHKQKLLNQVELNKDKVPVWNHKSQQSYSKDKVKSKDTIVHKSNAVNHYRETKIIEQPEQMTKASRTKNTSVANKPLSGGIRQVKINESFKNVSGDKIVEDRGSSDDPGVRDKGNITPEFSIPPLPIIESDSCSSPVISSRPVPQSPVIPAVKRRLGHAGATQLDPYTDPSKNPNNEHAVGHANKHLKRHNSENAKQHRNTVTDETWKSEFIPFLRTAERLDPSAANLSASVSRESSASALARRAYMEGQHPGVHGNIMVVTDSLGGQINQKDPIANPDLVTNQPTPRQHLILSQLKQLKETLLKRCLEAESYIPLSEFTPALEQS